MDKIRDEMAHGSQYIKVVGEYLTDYLLKHPEAEDLLKAENKSVAGSLETVKNKARAQAVGSVAVLDDQTVFGMVLDYFGIKGGAQTSAAVAEPEGPEADPFDLDALMGGL